MNDEIELNYHEVSKVLKYLQDQIKNLEASVESLNTENAGWLEMWQQDQSEIETLKGTISRLESDIQSLRDLISRLGSQIQSLRDKP